MDDLLDGMSLNTNCPHDKGVGTLVYLGNNRGPLYEIVHIEGPTAWVRQPHTYQGECLVSLNKIRVALDA
jgi:hypothetical protein